MNCLAESNGLSSNTGTVWHTSMRRNSVRVFHMETEQVYPRRPSTGFERKIRTLRDDNHQIDRPAEKYADRISEDKSKLSLASIHIDKNNSERTTKISKLGE